MIYDLNLSVIKDRVLQSSRLDDNTYRIQTEYNNRTGNYVMNIYNSQMEPILLGFLMLPYGTLYSQFQAYKTNPDEEKKLPYGNIIFVLDEGGE